MSGRDAIGLVVTYLYSFSLLGIASALHYWGRVSTDITRKFVHIGAGMTIFILYGLFDSPYWGIFPVLTFIVFNFVSYRFKLIKAIDLADESPGTVYFVISISFLLWLFWPGGNFWIAAAGIMAMTWGDAAASLVGKAVGQHRYRVGKQQRSFEGSLAMFGFSFISMGLVLAFGSGRDTWAILALAFILAALATLLESVSPAGTDNLLVPIGTSLALYFLVSEAAPLLRLFLGLLLSSAIGIAAYQRKALSTSGVLGAIITGTIIFGFGGWVRGLTLIAFFVYGTVLSKYKERQKNKVAAEKFDKGSRRDLGQALANGGWGAILALAGFLYQQDGWLFAAFLGAMATVNADTWATELGVLNKRPPRLITTGKAVAPGTSGGISPIGTSATALGGLVIGLTVWILLGIRFGLSSNSGWGNFWWVIPVGLVAGLLGSLSDSLMGATVQVMYTNAETSLETEKQISTSGQKNTYRRGLFFMNNDAVNFVSSGIGALVAVLLYWLLV